MKATTFLITLIFSGLAFATDGVPVTKVTHEVSSFIGVNVGTPGRIYYNCDSAERKVVDLLEQLGATNIDIRCSGGIDPNGGFTTLATIRGSFDSYVYNPESEEIRELVDVQLKGRQGCALVAELLWLLDDNFAIDSKTGPGSRITSFCNADRRYKVDLRMVQ